MSDPLLNYVKTICMSIWDGCACALPKGHEGLHECAAEACGCTWTTEQSDEWRQDLRRRTGE